MPVECIHILHIGIWISQGYYCPCLLMLGPLPSTQRMLNKCASNKLVEEYFSVGKMGVQETMNCGFWLELEWMWTLISLRQNPSVYTVLHSLWEQILIISGNSWTCLLLMLILFSMAISTLPRELLSPLVKYDWVFAPPIGGHMVVFKMAGFQSLPLSSFCYTHSAHWSWWGNFIWWPRLKF